MAEKLKIAYLRVSTEKQIDNTSLGEQRKRITAYYSKMCIAEEQITFMTEGGASAKTTSRPELKKLLQLVKEQRVERIAVYDLSRLSRNVADVTNLLSLFIKYDVNVDCVTQDILYTTADQRAATGHSAVQQQWDNEKRAERACSGMRNRAEEGKYVFGRLSYGYRRNENKHLVINEDEAVNVKRIFHMATEGYTQKEICDIFNDEAISGIYWTRNKINRIINNEIYLGKLNNHLVCIDDFCPAIIDDELYKRAKVKVCRRKRKTKHTYLFKSKIKCSVCGSICTCESSVKPDKLYKYYICCNCNNRISERKILSELIEQESFVELIDDFYDKKAKPIQIQKEKLGSAEKAAYKGLVSAKIDLDVYNGLILKINKDKVELNEKLNALCDKKNFLQMDNTLKRSFIRTYIKVIKVDLKLKKVENIERSSKK
ncbi:recombinase family protein [Dielma fastidiosa]|uniref:recombinase family protein n=1 Tax=Dielma fastidiosa TaxID=1034346 RepID=UPI0023F292E1|nr:recombinase family protein [Dielma fastidiosa]